ncbi:phage holin family protein [Microbacterium sp. BR1]|uniref:phage holin family protein n=1 Tax=Microbacterium sp. BR1 TaxID=1070896 RepID=UPI000C2BB521|nr:phage holin family protein [Microbacterium sp. BR1]
MSGAGPTASVSFDARPLIEPARPADIRAFTARLRAEGRLASPFSGSRGVQLVVLIVVAGIFALVFLSVFGTILTMLAASGSFGWLTVLPVLAMLAVGGGIAWIGVRIFTGSRERWYRLARFAEANAMSYVPTLADPRLPGMIFSQGHSRAANDLVRGEHPRFVEFANYRYVTGSGKNQSTHKWGYVAIKLDVPLPHILLDAVGNNGLFGSNLPTSFDRDQRLSLEGDFDKYFSLFCPRGYERDALYLFTPDIMARFIDNAAQLDVEIVDDWLFLYAKRDLSTLDPATWAWLFATVGALLEKFAQWSRWRDDRLVSDASARAMGAAGGPTGTTGGVVDPFAAAPDLRPPPGVAPEGRRLKSRVSVLGIVAVVLFVVIWAVSMFL